MLWSLFVANPHILKNNLTLDANYEKKFLFLRYRYIFDRKVEKYSFLGHLMNIYEVRTFKDITPKDETFTNEVEIL